MQLRQVAIERFRAIEALTLTPGPRNVLLGPQNAGKSSVLEALDLLLHHGIGRPRPAPTEIDYFGRDPTEGFVIEAVVGALDEPTLAETNRFLEGWRAAGADLSASRKETGSSRQFVFACAARRSSTSYMSSRSRRRKVPGLG